MSAIVLDRPAHFGREPVQPDRELIGAEPVGPRAGDRTGGDVAATVASNRARKIHESACVGNELREATRGGPVKEAATAAAEGVDGRGTGGAGPGEVEVGEIIDQGSAGSTTVSEVSDVKVEDVHGPGVDCDSATFKRDTAIICNIKVVLTGSGIEKPRADGFVGNDRNIGGV